MVERVNSFKNGSEGSLLGNFEDNQVDKDERTQDKGVSSLVGEHLHFVFMCGLDGARGKA